MRASIQGMCCPFPFADFAFLTSSRLLFGCKESVDELACLWAYGKEAEKEFLKLLLLLGVSLSGVDILSSNIWENLDSGSKGSLFHQNFLSPLRNDLNVHFHSVLLKRVHRKNKYEQ